MQTIHLDAVLATKTVVPAVRSRLLPRPGAYDRLDRAVACEVVLVSAPAGFGKTTLLAQWASGGSFPVAWLSLDPDDDDPVRFLRYLVAAIRRVEGGFGERLAALLSGPNRPAAEALGTVLVNELAGFTGNLVIVLDDYHVLQSRPVHELLRHLVAHLPASVHLVISSRADPPLPLARLRVRGQLAELRAADLRFARAEVSAFFQQVWQLPLDSEVIDVVRSRTEGWVAGLQLAALILQDAPDATAFAKAFTGTHRFVLDFLTEEILERQPDDVRQFLLDTSVLDRVSAPLAEALTARPDAGRVLDALERANMFLVPLDAQRRWYRYHQLFAEMLRARLRQDHPEREEELHHAAGLWCEQHGLVDEAIRHWGACGEPGRAAALVERHIEELILRTSERATMDRWLHSLPDEVVRHRPRLLVAQGISALIEGRLEEVEPLLEMAGRAPADAGKHEPTVGSHASVLGNVPAVTAIMRADVARLRGDFSAEETFAREAVGHLRPEDATLACFARYQLAVADWMSGRLPQAERGLQAVVAERLAAGERYLAARASYDLGQVQLARGSLRAAAVTYQRAIQVFRRAGAARPAMAGIGLAGLGEVRRERGDLEGALQAATEGAGLCRHLAYSPPLSAALVTLAWTRHALGDRDGAVRAIDEAAAVIPSAEISPLHDLARAGRARLLLAHGRIGEALRWVDERGLGDEDEVPYAREGEYQVLAHVLLATQGLDRARRLAERIGARAEAEGRVGTVIRLRALLALVLDAAGERDLALQVLATALLLARAEGQVAAFADEGPAMGGLLQRLVMACRREGFAALPGVPAEYVSRLIIASRQGLPDEAVSAAPAASAAGVLDPLTAREQEVLGLLAAGRTNREIAEELFVTVGTMKKHVGHICRKLGAANRTQAVAHARGLGLIR